MFTFFLQGTLQFFLKLVRVKVSHFAKKINLASSFLHGRRKALKDYAKASIDGSWAKRQPPFSCPSREATASLAISHHSGSTVFGFWRSVPSATVSSGCWKSMINSEGPSKRMDTPRSDDRATLITY